MTTPTRRGFTFLHYRYRVRSIDWASSHRATIETYSRWEARMIRMAWKAADSSLTVKTTRIAVWSKR